MRDSRIVARLEATMFSRLLVGFDGSPQAKDALSLAGALVAEGGRVTACWVRTPQALTGGADVTEPRLGRGGEQRSSELAKELVQGPVVTDTLIVGASDVASALQAAARRTAADLLVLGSCHRGRLGQAMLGSVAMEALHDPPCLVAVAAAGSRATDGPARLQSVAVGCDVVDGPGPELQVAVELATDLGVPLHVVAVADTRVSFAVEFGGAVAYPAVVKARRLAAEEGMGSVLAELPAEVSATGEVREGNPVEKLVEVSRGVDLLVVGSHHYGPIDRLMGRGVSSALARHARSSILVVPSAGRADGLTGLRS